MLIEQGLCLTLLSAHPIPWLLYIWDRTLKSRGSFLPVISLWSGLLCRMEHPRATLRILRYTAHMALRILVLHHGAGDVALLVACLRPRVPCPELPHPDMAHA